MKKKYYKPQIVFESLSMSERIAGDCELIVNFAKEACGVPMHVHIFLDQIPVIVFSNGTGSQCTFYPPEEPYDGFCYHLPIEAHNCFNS